VPDARLALSVLSGDRVEQELRDLRGLRVGRPVDSTLPACDTSVQRVLLAAADAAGSAGARLCDVEVPEWRLLRRVFVALQGGEAAEYHRSLGHWPSRAEMYDAGVRSRLSAACALSAAEVESAREQRVQLRHQVGELFERVEVLLQPVAGSGPSRVAQPDVVAVDGRVEDLRAHVLPHTLLASLCGLPACSVPGGLDADGLPVGVQVIGAPGRDDLVLDVAEVLHALLQPAQPSPG
jgi:Asp-tRNA(Asn)/Glu-tRNA(Gln) amidotransferase A subunit family amidase